MRVPSKDYARQNAALWPQIQDALRRCFLEESPVLGASVGRFEAAFAAYQEVQHAVGVGSGTAAATLLYTALGIGAGDAVLTCARTFPGVISAIALTGARPVLVDCEPDGSLSPQAVEAALSATMNSTTTAKVKAVMLVHLYGHAEAADEIAAVCLRHGVILLEDIAQAHGARWRGQRVGSFGRGSVVSFHPSKNLGAFGDGGAILTSDASLAERLRVLRNLGKGSKYVFDVLGPNSKLDTLQAALLEIKLSHLDGLTDRRRRLAARYLEGLHGLPGIKLPRPHAESDSVWHLFTIGCEDRDGLQSTLVEAGVRAGLHYPIAPHQQPGLLPFVGSLHLPEATRWAATTLTLPLSPELTDEEIEYVIATVRRWAC